MARQITEEVAAFVKDLITQMSGFQEGTDVFSHIEKHILTTLKKSDTMYFLNKREVDESIAGMAEKFNFHGFFQQAKALQECYKGYIPDNISKSELVNRLNIVKLLLCLSERPTSKFLEHPEKFETQTTTKEEEINWAEYLNEGIETWSPNADDSSDSSETCFSEDEKSVSRFAGGCSKLPVPTIIDEAEKDTVMDLRANREELLATIQHTWYNQKRFHMAPFSDWREANIAILWDKFLEDQVKGLIPIEKSSILSEYKVIREILWQMWTLHTSAVFELQGNSIKPKSNVTISSVRAECLENFLRKEFIPYMEALDFFRQFSQCMEIRSYDCIAAVPPTFRSYNGSLLSVIRPVYKQLVELEDKVREQETTYTLLKMALDVRSILKPVMVLKKIHQEVVINFEENSSLRCATVLICRLHDSLPYSVTKLEQDLRVTLFLDSLYHYFQLIDEWLVKNVLCDYSEEFVIVNKNENPFGSTHINDNTEASMPDCENWKLNFELRGELDPFCENNGIIKIIRHEVLQIGRNLHLLRLLGKFSVINDSKETIHQEFIRRSLEELQRFFNPNSEVSSETVKADETFFDCIEEKKYKYPVVCVEDCKKPTEFDKLENLVDTSDGFLMLAFEDYLTEKCDMPAKEEETLFQKVSKITTTMFPMSNFFEKILDALLKERFTISGLMVKNVLIDEYLLEKQFQFLRHVFLFCDDLISPFYRRLFEKTSLNSRNWGNAIWLTSHLHDVLADVYPKFYDRCLVQVKDTWRQCVDPSEACGMVEVQYPIQWPLNIVISSSQMALYKDIYRFVMRIKWALYTVNHLAFTDIQPKKPCKNQPKPRKNVTMKLQYLKFALTNIINSVQHYIFSFAVTKCLQKFELDFEKANDLSSIMRSHADFINSIHAMIMDIKQPGKDSQAFQNVMDGVKALKMMWTNVELATPRRLDACLEAYKRSYNVIDPIVCPKYIFDY